jgi:hypothetical protein
LVVALELVLLVLWEVQRAEIRRVRRALVAALAAVEQAQDQRMRAERALAGPRVPIARVVWAGTPEAYRARVEAEERASAEVLRVVAEVGAEAAEKRAREVEGKPDPKG